MNKLISTNVYYTSPKLNVYKSTRKPFIAVTKIVERDDSIMIKRTIAWYDSKTNRYRKRNELQIFNCDNVDDDNLDSDTYDEEFKYYNTLLQNENMIESYNTNLIE